MKDALSILQEIIWVVLGVIITTIVAVINYADKRTGNRLNNKSNRNNNWLLALLLLGSTITVISSVVTGLDKKAADKAKLAESNSAELFKDSVLKLSIRLNASQDSIIALQKDQIYHTKVILLSENEISKNLLSQVFPLKPMDIEISYTCRIDRNRFDMLCPYFKVDSLQMLARRGYGSGGIDTTIDIPLEDIRKADSKSLSFLYLPYIEIDFVRKINLLSGGQWRNKFSAAANGSDSLGEHYKFGYNPKTVSVTVLHRFKNVDIQNDQYAHVRSIKEIKFWLLSCILRKSDLDSVNVNFVNIFSGSSQVTQLQFTFKKRVRKSSNIFSFETTVEDANFIEPSSAP